MEIPTRDIINHVSKHQKKYVFFSFLGGLFALAITGLSIFNSNNQANAFDGGFSWENNDFITGAFREHNPNDNDIKLALFGNRFDPSDSTAYTSGRNATDCRVALVVQYLDPTDTIPSTLAANTIYVLNSGSYTITTPINFDSQSPYSTSCSALLGSGDVIIYSDTKLSSLINLDTGPDKNIIDNIHFDGINIPGGGTHLANSGCISYINNGNSSYNTFNNLELKNCYIGFNTYKFTYGKLYNLQVHNTHVGMYFYMFSIANTISNSQGYDNELDGVVFYSAASKTTIENSQFYNNGNYGINIGKTNDGSQPTFWPYSVTGTFDTINNNLIYNNKGGIFIRGSETATERQGPSSYNSINNNQIFNNGFGILIGYSHNNVINNNQIYNNDGDGISFTKSSNNIINNTYIYNNKGKSIFVAPSTSTGNIYYGTLKLFKNGTNDLDAYSTGMITSGGFNADFQRATGTIDTGSFDNGMSCLRATNPRRNVDLGFLLSLNCNAQGNTTTRTGEASGYLYMPFILKQIQPVTYSGEDLLFSNLAYDIDKYIAEINPIFGGAIAIDPNTYPTYTTNTGGHQIIIGCSEPCNYSITGNFEGAIMSSTIDSPLWKTGAITLTAGTGMKNFYATFTTGSLDTGYHTNRINYDVNPPTCMETIPECCNNNLLTTVPITDVTELPSILSGDTIYEIASGSYTLTSSRTFGNNCTLVKGIGNVVFTGSVNSLFNATGVVTITTTEDGPQTGSRSLSSIAIQNIKIKGNTTNYGISINNTDRFRLFDSAIYNTTTGLFLRGTTTNSKVSHSQFYNNSVGIEVVNSDHNLLNNVHVYNNSGYGIVLHDSANYNSISNSQIYKNGSGILSVDSSPTIFFNSQLYNNQNVGLSFVGSSGNELSAVRSYNNGIGISFDANSLDNYYYGTGRLFGNRIVEYTGTNLSDSYFTAGGIDPFAYRLPGIYLVDENAINPQYTTNPYTTSYLLSGYLNQIPGINTSWAPASIVSYLYMPGILHQLQPIIYTTCGFKAKATIPNGFTESYTFRSGSKYIAELNPKYAPDSLGLFGAITLANNKFYVTGATNTVVLMASEPVNYTLTGDFSGGSLSSTLGASLSGTQTIILTTGFADLYVTFSTGTKTYSEHVVINYPYVMYAPVSGAWTNDDVTLTLTGYTPSYVTDYLTLNGSALRTLSVNGATGYSLQDTGGNHFTVTGTVAWIDKVVPVFAGVDTGGNYSTGQTIYYHDDGGSLISGAVLSGINGNTYYNNTFASGYTPTGTGTFILTITDHAGNSTGAIFTINTSVLGQTACTPSTYFSGTLSVVCMTGAGGNEIHYALGGGTADSGDAARSDRSLVATTLLSVITCDSTRSPKVCGSPTSYVYTADNQAPTSVSFDINTGAIYTNLTGVTLTNITGLDNRTPIQIASSNSTTTGPWYDRVRSTGWTLPATDGTKTVYMRFRDAGGNTASWTTDSIILDQTDPIFAQSNGLPITSGGTYASLTIVFSDAPAGISGRVLTGINGTSYYSGTFNSGGSMPSDGMYRLTLTDYAGNSTGVTFTIDSSIPGTPVCSPGTPNALYRYSGSNVSVSCTGTVGNTVHYTSSTSTPPSAANSGSALRTTDISFTDTGYISVVSCTSAHVCSTPILYTYIHDATPPTPVAGGFRINTGALYTTGAAVWFTHISGTDSCNQVWVSYGTSSNMLSGSAWTQDFSNKLVTLSAAEGIQTGYIRFKDCAGNITGSFTDTIIKDTVVPSAIFQINTGASRTNITGVILTLSGKDDTSGLSGFGCEDSVLYNILHVPLSWNIFSGGAGQIVTGTLDYTLTTAIGVKTVLCEWIDKAGNTFIYQTGISYNNIPPQPINPGSGLFSINSGAIYTTGLSVVLVMNVAGATGMAFANSGEAFHATGAFALSTGWMLSGAWADGTGWVNGRFIDEYENVTGYADSIILDTHAPIFSGNGTGIISGQIYTSLLLTFTDLTSGISGNVATISGLNTAYITTAFASGTVFSTPGTFMFVVSDLAGNSTGVIFTIIAPVVSTPSGGSSSYHLDNCKQNPNSRTNLSGANASGIDYSLSYYDDTCLPSHQASQVCDVSKSPYVNEITNAFDRAYSLGITTLCPITIAQVNGLVTRREMAKMVTVFTIKSLGLKPDTTRKCIYTDMSHETQEMKSFAVLACQLNIMGLKYDGSPDTVFRPSGLVTRAQFGTILSRLLYGDKYNGDRAQRYRPHLLILQQKKIMNVINTPKIFEKRGYIMIMLMRSIGGHPELFTNKISTGTSIGTTFSGN